MSNAVEQRKLCQQCKTQVAVLKVDNRIVCIDCQSERPIIPLKKWDEMMTPNYILAMERRIEQLEKTGVEYGKALYDLKDILKTMSALEDMTAKRLRDMESIIQERTADS